MAKKHNSKSANNNTPEYVFRGTTLSFAGGSRSVSFPVTCTSSCPLTATLFALASKNQFSQPSVIYMASTEVLFDNKIDRIEPNVLYKVENEIAWKIKPLGFYKNCIGYIGIDEMINCLRELGINLSQNIRLDNLSQTIENTMEMDVEQIKELVKIISPNLKNNNGHE